MGLFDSKLDEARVEIARLNEQLRVTQKLCDSMRQEKIDLEGRLVKATAQLNKLLEDGKEKQGLIDRLFGRGTDVHRTTTPDVLGIASANYAACMAEIANRNEEAQRHKELMGALARIEAAIRLRTVEVGTSIKVDAPKVDLLERINRGEFGPITAEKANESILPWDWTKHYRVGDTLRINGNVVTVTNVNPLGMAAYNEFNRYTFSGDPEKNMDGVEKLVDAPRGHAGGSGIPVDHNGEKTFFKGDRVVMDDSTHLSGVVEWCNEGMCRVQFDSIGHIAMPSVVYPCASLKRETPRPFQIGDRVRAPKFQTGEGEITRMHGDGFVVAFPQATYYFETEHLELIKGEA